MQTLSIIGEICEESEKKLIEDISKININEEMILHLNSSGGSFDSALSMLGILKNIAVHNMSVTVAGTCSSCAFYMYEKLEEMGYIVEVLEFTEAIVHAPAIRGQYNTSKINNERKILARLEKEITKNYSYGQYLRHKNKWVKIGDYID